MTNTSFALSPACFSVSSISPTHCNYTVNINKRRISCEEVTVKSNNSTASVGLENNPSSLSSSDDGFDESKIGARVKVNVPLKVYHIPRVSEVDLTSMEGMLKQYVAVWKGNKISANLPYKVQFVTEIQGRGAVKFFAHLKEDEFEYLD